MQHEEQTGERGNIAADFHPRQLRHAHVTRQPNGPDGWPVFAPFVALSHESFSLLPLTGYSLPGYCRPGPGWRAVNSCGVGEPVTPPISAFAARARDTGPENWPSIARHAPPSPAR